MTNICNCVCGAEARLARLCGQHIADDTHHVECSECGWEGPYKRTPAEAVEAWNERMKPRPAKVRLVRSRDFHNPDNFTSEVCANIGAACLGFTDLRWTSGYEEPEVPWAFCRVHGEESKRCETQEEAIAWLVSRIESAGFDVERES